MKQKHLESCLSSLPHRVFPNPKIELEQYPTSVHLTASIILSALAKGDAGPGTSVLDLGCGTGILGLGFALVQSDMVYLVDCDPEALELARENVDMLEEEELIGRSSEVEEGEEDGCLGVELVMAKVKYIPPKREKQGRGGGGRGHRGGRGGRGKKGKGRGGSNNALSSTPQNDLLYSDPNSNDDDGIPLPSKVVDTVITNPPFGTKQNEGIDVQFLRCAIRLARRAVYSFHKTSTRPFLLKLLREKWGLNAEVVAEMKFDIPNMYKFHKQKCVDVEVDLLRIWKDDEKEEDGAHDKGDGEDHDDYQNELSEGEEMPLGLCGHA
ncbi:hypothetical protein ACHAXR_013231 [Thalassiosira sp. AJA248-18]